MSFYTQQILPHLLDCACNAKAFRMQRKALVPRATGIVLDVGVGTGRNLQHYVPERVQRLIGLDPCETSLAVASERAAKLQLPFEPIQAGAEAIPLPRHSIDTVVLTFTLCTVPNVEAAAKELRRVLKPNGAILFCEHGLADRHSAARLQRFLDPVWRRVFGGCRLTREPDVILGENGFQLIEHTRSRGSGAPPPVAWHRSGVAVPVLPIPGDAQGTLA